MPVVQGVIVGQVYAVDPEMGQDLYRPGRRTKEERLSRGRPGLAPVGDAAFQVQDAEVRFVDCLEQGRGEERSGRFALERGTNAGAHHGIAGQRNPYAHDRRSSAQRSVWCMGSECPSTLTWSCL